MGKYKMPLFLQGECVTEIRVWSCGIVISMASAVQPLEIAAKSYVEPVQVVKKKGLGKSKLDTKHVK
jgi:hypothetical protein